MKKLYAGSSIHYYRGALDAAKRECEAIEIAVGIAGAGDQRSRLWNRLMQLETLVAAIEAESVELMEES